MSRNSLPPGADEDALTQAASMAELGVLTASLLHELRQPLFAIKAYAQLARADDAGRLQRIEGILEQVRHVEALLNYYGGFARTDEPEAVFDFNHPVRAALEMLGYRTRRAKIFLETDLAPVVLLVRGREVAARQVATNLIQNACDAVEDIGGGRVCIRTRDLGDAIRLEVEDAGPGVPEEVRDRLFEPFVTTKPPGRGTGLGLFIARRLVAEACGTLEVEQVAGGGARFVAEFPRAFSGGDARGGDGDLGFG